MISIGSTIDDASNTTTAQNLTIVTEQTARFRPNPHCSHVNKRIVDAPFEQVAPSRVLMLSQRKRQRTENAQKAAITASAEKDANSSGGAAGQESAAEDVVSEPPLVVSDSSEISEPAIMHEHQSEMMILKEELTSSSPRMTSQQVETSLKGARDFFDKIFTVLKGDLANTEFTSNSSTTANRYDTYGGLAGTALFFYRIHQSSSNNYVDAIQLAKRCIEEACQLVDLLDLSMHSMETGLMKSPCGVWAIASLGAV